MPDHQAQHTPGPWHTGNKGSDSVFTETGHRVCTVMPRLIDPARSALEDFATARLIAAAPEMYAALKAAKALLDESIYELTPDHAAVHNYIARALAKAEGQQP